ncbi:MAG TPA: hypothetical protein DD378_06250, partial [Dialister sp.]|nr:hypothetical protein [Dialister sp.]
GVFFFQKNAAYSTAAFLLAKIHSILLCHYGSRSFTFTHYDTLPSAVILNGGKNALWERRETEQ